MSVRKPDDLTLDEIKEQMALYQRLYYHRVKETPEYKEKKAETQRQYYLKKKAKKEEEKNKMKKQQNRLIENMLDSIAKMLMKQ